MRPLIVYPCSSRWLSAIQILAVLSGLWIENECLKLRGKIVGGVVGEGVGMDLTDTYCMYVCNS